MLMTTSQVVRAMDLTVARVNLAMRRGGYTDAYTAAKFVGLNRAAQFVYQVSGWDYVEGATVTGQVFIEYNNEGVLVGDY